ncbi:MAG: LLM class flavin-dependent oxidoreductase [Deltaproteobacteria bacterium]|nr:LLM class flavin-dependent oxidoreductase [Deltaproteobacteria bacterium]
MATNLRFGLLLPHFCEHASMDACIAGARRAEAYGFDSVWVRDHLVFTPHRSDGIDNTHIEGLLVLSAVAAATQKLTLGTAMAICHRQPIHLAQAFAGLSAISKGRVVMGMGLGGFPQEFAAAGWPSALADRVKLARANVDICRRLWAGETLSHKSEFMEFHDVALKPTPQKPIPIWVGGGTPASCRRAAEYGDGWMPARITLLTFEQRIGYLRELCAKQNRAMLETAVMPFTTIGKNQEDALKGMRVDNLIDEAHNSSSWVKPPSGKFSTLADLRGVILAGATQDIVRETRAYEQAGANHIVYDLRLRYKDWHEQIDLLGKHVLPALRG